MSLRYCTQNGQITIDVVITKFIFCFSLREGNTVNMTSMSSLPHAVASVVSISRTITCIFHSFINQGVFLQKSPKYLDSPRKIVLEGKKNLQNNSKLQHLSHKMDLDFLRLF